MTGVAQLPEGVEMVMPGDNVEQMCIRDRGWQNDGAIPASSVDTLTPLKPTQDTGSNNDRSNAPRSLLP